MNKQIKLLLLTLGFGLLSVAAQASCDPCDSNSPPPECDQDNNNNDGDSMPEGVVIDDMPTAVFADVETEITTTLAANVSAKTE